MRLPNFFIVGAAKAGTTSLWRYLLQHPEVFMPGDLRHKEPAFFSDIKGGNNLDQYKSLFSGVRNEKMIGEASTAYLTSPESPSRIVTMIPNVKIIIMLRNPIDRAFSLYNWMACNGYEPIESFEKALETERSDRYGNVNFLKFNPEYYYNYLYFYSGLYSQQIKRYLDVFNKEQVHFIIFENFKSDINQEIQKVYKFLGVNETFSPETKVHNKGSVPYSTKLQFFIRQELNKYLRPPYTHPHPLQNKLLDTLMRLNTRPEKPMPMKKETRELLSQNYYQDVLLTGEMIDVDLSKWWCDFQPNAHRSLLSQKISERYSYKSRSESSKIDRQKDRSIKYSDNCSGNHRIWMIADHQKAGGAAIACHRLFTGLNKRKIDLKFLTFNPPYSSERNCYSWESYFQKISGSDPNVDSDASIPGKQYRSSALLGVINKARPEIINVHNIHEAIHYHGVPFDVLDLLSKDARLVFTLHDMWLLTGRCAYTGNCQKFIDLSCDEKCPTSAIYPQARPNDISALLRMKTDFFKRNPDAVFVTPSQWLCRQFKKSYLKNHRIEVIPYGIDTTVFRPDDDRDNLRRSIGISRKANVLLISAANLSDPRKGAHLFLKALSEIKGEIIVLTIGKTELKPKLPQNIKFYNYGFVTSPEEMALAYSIADVFICPSLEDNLPCVLIESISCGTPCIGFNVGGVPEVVRPGETGWLAQETTSESLSYVISSLIRSPDKISDLRSSCRKVAKEEYALDIQSDRYLSLYNELNNEEAWIFSESLNAKCREIEINQNKEKSFDDNLNNLDENDSDEYLVSAIVSTYNAERFIEGCLENLENQTISDKLEIIVVNSGSMENEETIVREYQQKYDNIKYIKTESRETVYAAWNRGIKAAKGKYITNANTDDRRFNDGIEILVKALEENSNAPLVYGNFYITDKPNNTKLDAGIVDSTNYPDYERGSLLLNCYPGPMPVWRRSVHTEFGYFNETYVSAGDREFWCRISQKYELLKLENHIGIYFLNPKGVEHKNKEKGLVQKEAERIMFRYSNSFNKAWDSYRQIRLHVNGDFNQFKLEIDRLETSGGGFRLQVDVSSCDFDDYLWLIKKKEEGLINNLNLTEKGRESFPTVSMVMFTFDRLKYTKKTLHRLMQSTRYPFQLKIIDNKSSDGTQEWLKEIRPLYADRIIDITYNNKNEGLPGPTNSFWQSVNTDLIGKIDNDTLVPDRWLERLIEAHTRIPKLAIVGGYHFRPEDFDEDAAKTKIIEENGIKILTDRHIGGCCYLMKKSVQEKFGMMDVHPSLKTHGWTQYQWMVSGAGYVVGYLYPLVQLEYMDDPRSENCLIDTEYQKYARNIWRERGIEYKHTDQLVSWIRNDAARVTMLPKVMTDVPLKKRLTFQKEKNFTPLVSIVILTHNQIEYTKLCLKSIVTSTPLSIEIIVVDNGSKDGTVEFLESESEKSDLFFPLRIIKNAKNLGFASGNNLGMAVARGKFVLLLNNDVVVTRGWLNRMIACAQKHPLSGIIGPRSNYVSGPQLVREVQYNTETLEGLDTFSDQFAQKNNCRSSRILRVVGFCMLIKKSVVDKIGGLDTRYGLGNFEDDDFSLRAALSGYESWVAEDCFIHHFGSRTFRGANIDFKESLENNWKIFKKKWGLPADMPYGEPYNISQMSVTGFDPRIHFFPLPVDGVDLLSNRPENLATVAQKYLKILSGIDKNDLKTMIVKLNGFAMEHPDFDLVHNDLGVLYYQEGLTDKALNSYRKAVALDSINITFRKNLADFLYVEEGRVEEALEHYVEVLRIKPDDVETLLITGHICTAIERFEDAISFYQKVLDIEPQNLDATQNLEALEKRQMSMLNQEAEGKEKTSDQKEVNGVEPHDSSNELSLILEGVVEDFIKEAEILFQREKIDQAVDTLLKAIAVHPQDGRTYIELAAQLINHSRHKQAFDVLAEMPANQPVAFVTQWLLIKGYAEEGLGDYDSAEKSCDGVFAHEPKNAKAFNLNGILDYRNGNKATAEQKFKRAIELDPEYGEPHTNLGTLAWEASELKMALKHYERGFSISPFDIDVANAYHEAVTATGEYKRAEKVARYALKKYPQCRKVHYLLIDTLIRQKKNEEALKEMEIALSNFGIDEGLLDTALAFQERVGKIKKTGSNKKPCVSLCMIVKDEEACLVRCLASVKPIVDEMVIVDTGSTDRTKDVAEFFGAHVYDFRWNDDFAAARNFSLSKARGKWIFIMDADEVISPRDYGRFRKIVHTKTVCPVAYSIVTRNYCHKANTIGWNPNDGHYAHEEAGIGWLPSAKVRLFSNYNNIKFEGAVHEMVDPVLKRLSIKIMKCAIPVHHFGRLNTDKLDQKGLTYYEIGRKKLAENGGDISAVRELAIQATILEKNSEAIDLWEKFLSMKPDNRAIPEAFVNMGTVYIRMKDYQKALNFAQKAVAVNPDMKEAQYNLGMAELFNGETVAAVRTFKRLIKSYPDFPPAQFLLAASKCCQKNTTDSNSEMKKLKQSSFGPVLSYSVAEIAEDLMTADQHKLAFKILQNAIENEIVNKDILHLYSVCLEKIKGITIWGGESQAAEIHPETTFECS